METSGEISPADKASFLADSAKIKEKIDTLIEELVPRARVPTLTPIGIAALMGLLTLIATSTILKRKKG
ncbi:MAG: hypothetical protein KAU16_07610 [Methanophagales archaeon]|nr:hypothetical protein [Methanophagales archaeon]